MRLLLYCFLCSTLCYAQPKGMKPVGGTAPAGTERRLALVVGNKTYLHIGKLTNPHNDADDMAAALKRLGFEVIVRKDLAQSDFLRAIDDFGRRLSQYDVGLFYYSGHGLQFNGENYLVPTDANAQTAPEIEYSCVKLGRTLAKMEGANLKVSLALLDACRDNPFPAATRSAVAKGLAIPNNPPGSFVAYSTRAGSTADDNATARNGLFTSELLRYLSTPNAGIRSILDRTTQGVRSRSNGQQIPGRYDELTGDFVFVQAATDTPAPHVPPKQEESVPTNTAPTPAATRTAKFMDLPFAELVYVPGGTFEMGDVFGEGESNEKPVHAVMVGDFLLGKYEVTQRQWREIMGTNPSYFENCDDCPVEQVSWEDVQVFLQKLNAREGRTGSRAYRLPTEAEWEYAARGGGKRVRFGTGRDVLDASEANFDGRRPYRQSYSKAGDYRGNTIPVGSLNKSNDLGLHDMTGNVWEWCSDWYSVYRSYLQFNPTGTATGSFRVLRGGSWLNYPQISRVAYRYYNTPAYRGNFVGFRVLCPQ
jgi:formylglycine-generating enzyme required for sulfatase activity